MKTYKSTKSLVIFFFRVFNDMDSLASFSIDIPKH